MEKSEKILKVVAIILAVALVFTIVTSNIVSITAITALKKASSGTVVSPDGGGTGTDNGGGGTASTTKAGSSTGATTSAVISGTNGTNATTAAGNNNGGGGTTPTTPVNNDTPPAQQGMSAEEVFNFYKAACDKIKNDGIAGHTRKEWQDVTRDVDVGSDLVNGIVKPIIARFMKGEADAGESVSEKGSDDARNRMCPAGASFGTVKSAVCEEVNGNYKITIVMNTQKAMFSAAYKGADGVPLMSTGILYPEDVKDTVQNDETVSKFVKSIGDDSYIEYQDYTIVAEMTKDGQFISIDHSVLGDIYATAKVSRWDVTGTGALTFHSKWYNFQY